MHSLSRSEIMALLFVVIAACCATAWAQQQQQTTPVPILKQINRQNEDGSYSYGYEAADGTFKIETKYPTGDVYGKYGYVDVNGKVRTVEYGASKKGGFNPAGTDINVPPPTLVQASNTLSDSDYDDGQYREDPSVYYKAQPAATPVRSKVSKSRFHVTTQAPAPAYDEQQYIPQPTASQSLTWSAPAQSRSSWSQPQQTWNQQSYAPAPANNYERYQGHPNIASIDPISGSYSLSYVG